MPFTLIDNIISPTHTIDSFIVRPSLSCILTHWYYLNDGCRQSRLNILYVHKTHLLDVISLWVNK